MADDRSGIAGVAQEHVVVKRNASTAQWQGNVGVRRWTAADGTRGQQRIQHVDLVRLADQYPAVRCRLDFVPAGAAGGNSDLLERR